MENILHLHIYNSGKDRSKKNGCGTWGAFYPSKPEIWPSNDLYKCSEIKGLK